MMDREGIQHRLDVDRGRYAGQAVLGEKGMRNAVVELVDGRDTTLGLLHCRIAVGARDNRDSPCNPDGFCKEERTLVLEHVLEHFDGDNGVERRVRIRQRLTWLEHADVR